MVTGDDRKPAWPFYPAWVVVSAISMLIAWPIAWAIITQVVKAVGDTIQVAGQRHITEDFLMLYILLPILGLVAGLLQYLLLRRYLPRMAWWIAATVLGWLLLSIALGLFALAALAVPPMLMLVLVGGCVALPQWWLLRQRVHRAEVWLLASLFGWGAAFLSAGGTVSNQLGALTVMLIPPIAASIAWWLMLGKLPRREGNGGNAPRDTSMPLGAH